LKNDYIQMPERQKFIDTVRETAAQGYYATLLHELMHWTGNSTRCDRSYPEKSSYEAYAFEELVAELGAAFLCGDLGVLNVPRDWAEVNDVSNPPQGQEYGQLQNHAAYLHSWIKALKEKDHPERMLAAAASLAEKAIDHLEGLQPKK
jgi:antirestriction protein ArdC